MFIIFLYNSKEVKVVNKSSVGSTWQTVRKELFTPKEIAKSNLRVELIGKLIKRKNKKN